jgi:hypothetical protein
MKLDHYIRRKDAPILPIRASPKLGISLNGWAPPEARPKQLLINKV